MDGQSLTLVPDRSEGDRRHRFDVLRYRWSPDDIGARQSNRRARATADLATSDVPRDVAELQWRRTLPWLTLGMTLVAGALGTVAPGRVTALRMAAAIVAYVLVFNIAAGARSAVETGTLPQAPGIYWLPVLPFALLGLLMLWLRRRT